MRRLWEWLRSFGRNTRMDLPLHTPRVNEWAHRQQMQQVDHKLTQAERELAIIVANMTHSNERFDDADNA